MIPIKPKPCKSKCGQVGYYSIKTRGMCYSCYGKWLYNTPEGQKKKEAVLKRQQQKKEAAIRKEKQDARKQLRMMDKKYYEKVLQKEINKLARLIDYGQKCLARDIPTKQAHGGHVLSRGGNQSARFNLHNIFIQSSSSNHWQNDDRLMHEGLARVFGEKYQEFNDTLKGCPPIKCTPAEYEQLCKVVRKCIREVEKNNVVRTPAERILLRNKYNLLIGIYPEKYSVFTL